MERLLNEAKKYEAEDRRRRELAEARNEADSIIYQTEKFLRELGDQVPGSDRSRIEETIRDLREAMKGDDTARIRRLTEQLRQASMALGQQMYARQQAAGGSGGPRSGGAGPSGGPGDVIEGEFREA